MGFAGKYNVQIRAFTAEDDDMLCENLRVGEYSEG